MDGAVHPRVRLAGHGDGSPYPRADPADIDRLPGDTWATAQLPVGVRLEFTGDASAVEIELHDRDRRPGYRGKGAGTHVRAWRRRDVVDGAAVLGDGRVPLATGGTGDGPLIVYLPEGMRPTILSVRAASAARRAGAIAAALVGLRRLHRRGLGGERAVGCVAGGRGGRPLGLDVVNCGYAGSARGEIAVRRAAGRRPRGGRHLGQPRDQLLDAHAAQRGHDAGRDRPRSSTSCARAIPDTPIVVVSPGAAARRRGDAQPAGRHAWPTCGTPWRRPRPLEPATSTLVPGLARLLDARCSPTASIPATPATACWPPPSERWSGRGCTHDMTRGHARRGAHGGRAQPARPRARAARSASPRSPAGSGSARAAPTPSSPRSARRRLPRPPPTDKTYMLGPAIVALGRAAAATEFGASTTPGPAMERLSDDLGLQCVASAAIGDEIVILGQGRRAGAARAVGRDRPARPARSARWAPCSWPGRPPPRSTRGCAGSAPTPARGNWPGYRARRRHGPPARLLGGARSGRPRPARAALPRSPRPPPGPPPCAGRCSTSSRSSGHEEYILGELTGAAGYQRQPPGRPRRSVPTVGSCSP